LTKSRRTLAVRPGGLGGGGPARNFVRLRATIVRRSARSAAA